MVYHDDDVEMQNRGNGGKGPRQIIPHVAQPYRVEEVGLLVPQVALDVVLAQPTQAM